MHRRRALALGLTMTCLASAPKVRSAARPGERAAPSRHGGAFAAALRDLRPTS
jgi:hypothetical protein